MHILRKPSFINKNIYLERTVHCSRYYPANTTRWNNNVLMLAQRLRRWPNIKTSLLRPSTIVVVSVFYAITLTTRPAHGGCYLTRDDGILENVNTIFDTRQTRNVS